VPAEIRSAPLGRRQLPELVGEAAEDLVLASRCSWIFTASCITASASLYVASDRLSEAVASRFCPTMMTDSSTSWRKVCEIHDTNVTALCDLMAWGRLMRAKTAKAYAHHMVPTPLVILTANRALKRAMAVSCGS
jgi:hypothetical protein